MAERASLTHGAEAEGDIASLPGVEGMPPDVMTAIQFNRALRRVVGRFEAEFALAFAVFEDAINLVKGGRRAETKWRRHLDDAWGWIDDGNRGIYSFAWCCGVFNLEVSAVRIALEKFRHRIAEPSEARRQHRLSTRPSQRA